MKQKIKRGLRVSRYVIYKETLVDRKEHFWSFLGAFIGIGLIAFATTSCKMNVSQAGSTATPDTLTYAYKGFKQRAADCGNKPDSSCTVITLKYPVFSGQKKLNDSVMARLDRKSVV